MVACRYRCKIGGVLSCVPGTACFYSVPVSLQVCGVLLCVPGTACFLACRFRCNLWRAAGACLPAGPQVWRAVRACLEIFLLRFGVLLACLASIVLTQVWRACIKRAWLLLCLLRFSVLLACLAPIHLPFSSQFFWW